MPTPAQVSVITAIYNSEKFLEETVRSVAQQTLKPVEHILIDDGSSDSSLSLAKELATIYPHIVVASNSRNIGFPATLNRGIALASGYYVGILDSDDIATPQWLSTVTSILDLDITIAAAGGAAIMISEEGIETGNIIFNKAAGWKAAHRWMNPFAHPGTIWRKTSLQKAGGYDPRMHGWEDIELFSRVAPFENLMHCGEVIIKYRLRSSSNSARGKAIWSDVWKTLELRDNLISNGVSPESATRQLSLEFNSLQTRWEELRIQHSASSYVLDLAEAYEAGQKYDEAAKCYLSAVVDTRYRSRAILGVLRNLKNITIKPGRKIKRSLMSQFSPHKS